MPSPPTACRQRLSIGITTGQPMQRNIPLPIASVLQSPEEWLQLCDAVDMITASKFSNVGITKRLLFKGPILREWGNLVQAACRKWCQQRTGIKVVLVTEQPGPLGNYFSNSRYDAHFQVLLFDPVELMQAMLRRRQAVPAVASGAPTLSSRQREASAATSRTRQQHRIREHSSSIRSSSRRAPRSTNVVAERLSRSCPHTPNTQIVNISSTQTILDIVPPSLDNVPIVNAELVNPTTLVGKKKMRPEAHVVVSSAVSVLHERLPVSRAVVE